jgi:hypothetical protein
VDLQKRLAAAANQNAQAIGKPLDPPSGEATVVARDKATGQYIIKRNGALEMAESATNGALKPGVNLPAEQGKIFATPHQPRPKPSYGFPQVAKASEHNVFIAYLPIKINFLRRPYANTLIPPLGFGITSADKDYELAKNPAITYDRKAVSFRFESHPNPRPAHSWEATQWDFNGDTYNWSGGEGLDGLGGFDYLDGIRMDLSSGYKILKQVIDFVFPKTDEFIPQLPNQNRSVSDNLLPLITGFGSYNGPGTGIEYRTDYTYVRFASGAGIDLRNPSQPILTNNSLSPVTILYNYSENFDGSAVVPTPTYGEENVRALRNLMLRAFRPDSDGITRKKLIIIPYDGEVLLRVGDPDRISNDSPAYPGYVMPSPQSNLPINKARDTIRARLFGAISHGEGMASGRRSLVGSWDESWHEWQGPFNPTSQEFDIYREFNGVLDIPINSRAPSTLNGGATNFYTAMTTEDFSRQGMSPFNGSAEGNYPYYRIWYNKYFAPAAPYGHYWNTIVTPLKANKPQKEFTTLIESMTTAIESTRYINRSYYFSGVYKDDPLQTLYGDAETPHYWIKGVSLKNVESVDIEAICDEFGVSEADRDTGGFR